MKANQNQNKFKSLEAIELKQKIRFLVIARNKIVDRMKTVTSPLVLKTTSSCRWQTFPLASIAVELWDQALIFTIQKPRLFMVQKLGKWF